MKVIDIGKPEIVSKLIGGVFIVLGIYLLMFTPHMNASLGALFIGIFSVLILNFPTVEKDTALSELESSIAPLENILDDLDLKGKGVFIPPREELSETRVFIPAGEFEGLPKIYDEMTIVPGGKGKTGVSIPPPGYPLVEEAKERMEYEMEGESVEEARELMGMMAHGLDLVKSFSFRKKKDIYKLRLTQGTYMDVCSEIKKMHENITTRTGCPISSAFLAAAAEGVSRPLRITDFEEEGVHMKYTLKVAE